MDSNYIAEAVRQVAPGNGRAIAEDDGINEQAIGRGRHNDMAFAAGQEIFDPSPLIVAQGMAMHSSASELPTTRELEKK